MKKWNYRTQCHEEVEPQEVSDTAEAFIFGLCILVLVYLFVR